MIALWLRGLIRMRGIALAGTAAGVALAVAMLASLAAFLSFSAGRMTSRAVAGVLVDWQVQTVPGASLVDIEKAVRDSAPVTALQSVGYGRVDGFEARTGGTVQTTGPGAALGMDPSYHAAIPGQLRLLLGSLDGAVLAQQTAANLHATVGDPVLLRPSGLPPVSVMIAGIVDLPGANALFQAVGVPPGAAPQAPPDNVLILPMAQWNNLFGSQATSSRQLHVRLDHGWLPADPGAAYQLAQRSAWHLESALAGGGLVGNNLAARLDAVRSDALYAKILFLFLGLPGALVAAALTIAVAAAGRDQRRRDQALLRIQGARPGKALGLAAAEAALVGLAGGAAGLGAAWIATRAAFGVSLRAADALTWGAAALSSGLLLACAGILVPAWRDARSLTVAETRRTLTATRTWRWTHLGLDYVLLALAGLIFWRTWSSGYQIVLAPEGVPAAQVDYLAFLAPLLFWTGTGLLTLRLCLGALGRGRLTGLTRLIRGLAGPLAGLVAAAMGRQRRRLAQGAVMVSLAFAFAVSTAIFDSTYEAQARVDAELTNGADVTVMGPAAAARLGELRALPGVTAAQPMHHQLAYVGNDLQDIYGIDPLRIGEATRMSGAYFKGGDAGKSLELLAWTPDGVLVSEETVNDFQLKSGDKLILRLQDARTHQYRPVPFRFVGVVREFPTAPLDSFLVANGDYLARQTGTVTADVVLVKTPAPGPVAAMARRLVAAMPGVRVSDLDQAARIIGSSLTAVDLKGLTRLELGFALLLAFGGTGLVLALGLGDRRRTFAILTALGAGPRQLGGFVWSEILFIGAIGAGTGILIGYALAWMLTKLLTGVFDPPPDSLSIPWPYLALLTLSALAASAATGRWFLAGTRLSPAQRMRDL